MSKLTDVELYLLAIVSGISIAQSRKRQDVTDEWEESKHPRDKDGKFSSSGSSKSSNSILSSNSKIIAGVKQGTPMDFKQARKNINPTKDLKNCQTCVIAYEARLRGYKVAAKSNDGMNTMISALERNPNMAWIDPKTGSIPNFSTKTFANAQDCYNYLNEIIKQDERYTIGWRWNNDIVGHTVSIGKDENDNLYLYDPQNNEKITDKEKLLEYFRLFDYNSPVKLLRTDNLELFVPIVNNILTDAKK